MRKARDCSLLVVFAATVSAATGCGNGTHPPAIVTTPDASGPAVDASLGDPIVALGCGSAGLNSTGAASGSKVGFLSLAPTTMTQPCTIMPMEMPVTDNVQLWNVCYAVSNPDGTFSTKIIATQPYTNPTQASLVYDGSGNANITFAGEGAMPSTQTCGANDAFVTVDQGSGFSTPYQVSDGSTTSGQVAAMANNCPQGICSMGDTSGQWPAIAINPMSTTFIAYRDIHNGFAVDDFADSNVDVAEGSGMSFSDLMVDVARGAGTYNRIALTPAGLVAIVSYDGTGTNPGVYCDVQLKACDLGTQAALGGWGASQISQGPAGEGLGFAISAQGLFAVAYYDVGSSRLIYAESMDGLNWSGETSVDLVGSTGFYPSLAFDPDGNPAIAYYRCSDNASTGMDCSATQDGLLLARRSGTTWTVQTVRADPAVNDGLYPALEFVNGKYVIAYQITTFDDVSMTSSATWWAAEEQ
jgi:hypothetical protein